MCRQLGLVRYVASYGIEFSRRPMHFSIAHIGDVYIQVLFIKFERGVESRSGQSEIIEYSIDA